MESKSSPMPPPDALRVLVLSSLFPSADSPAAGVFIRERMFRLARDVPLVVVAPVAWSPFDGLIRCFRQGFRPAPVRHEVMQGVHVHRPRYFSFPGVFKRFDGLLMAVCCYPALHRLTRDFRPTLIDAHFLYPDGYAATWLGARFRLPVTVSIRGSKDQRLLGTSRERALRIAAGRADGLIPVSRQLRIDVLERLGLGGDKVCMIGNGVDLERFELVERALARQRLGLEPDAQVLLGVGNLIPLKGFQRVIPLLPALRDRFPQLRYLIVGGSGQQASNLPQLRALAAEHGVEDIVRFCGPQAQDELKWYYGAADVFVLATEYEGWANVFLESMACGLPVVTTRVGGNPEVVSNPEVGTLVDFWNPGLFAEAIADALERRWDGERLRKYAESHSWVAKVGHLRCFLQQVISKHAKVHALE